VDRRPSSWDYTPCSFGLSAISQQYFSLRTKQPSATSQQYFSLKTNQHQPSATSQTNRLLVSRPKEPSAELVYVIHDFLHWFDGGQD
jgi:hypothetical protein